MTQEQAIIDFIENEMLDISISNGYSFDIDGQVFIWRDSPFEETELPAIIIRDTSNEADGEDIRRRTLTIDIALEDVGDNSVKSVREKKQDILTAFSNIIQSDLVIAAEFLSSETFSEQELKRAFFTALQFTCEYMAEDEWKI